MRKLSANLILPVSSPPLINGIVHLDEDGNVHRLIDTGGKLSEESSLEFYYGVIVPGFILPWVHLDILLGRAGKSSGDRISSLDAMIAQLDRELPRYGISGMGLVIPENHLNDEGLKRMSSSGTVYHPVIEICPDPEEDHFTAFSRGIKHASGAFNDFDLSCSLTASSPAMKGDMAKYLEEYALSHQNVVPLPDMELPGDDPLNIAGMLPRKGIEKEIAKFTLNAAAHIFEDQDLGSIEPGKRPGLNLIDGKGKLKVLA